MMKVSVLVPIYGVEKYIEQCAVSLFEQTYQDLEYIFVDDCTPDKSVEVLQQVMERYPQRKAMVRILRHDKNRGLGAARATALDAATGDYVLVVDSDDFVSTDAVERLCRRQQETDADIIDAGYTRWVDGKAVEPTPPFTKSSTEYLKLMLVQNTVEPHIWGRLMRKRLFTDHDINSIEGINLAEDYAVVPRLLFFATRATVDATLYFYRINAESTFRGEISQAQALSIVNANRVVYEFFVHHDSHNKYLCPLEIGMLKVYYTAVKAGISANKMERITGFRPTFFYIKWCRALFASHPGLMRKAYLVIKRLYRTWL